MSTTPRYPCSSSVVSASEGAVSSSEADLLIDDLMAALQASIRKGNQPGNAASQLQGIGAKMVAKNSLAAKLQKRNALLVIKAQNRVREFAKGFKNPAEALMAYNEGVRTRRVGGRLSIDAQTLGIRNKYLGTLLSDLEKADLLKDFVHNTMEEDVFRELWHLRDPNVSMPTGNKKANTLAKIIHNLQTEVVARENRAGSFIATRMDYVIRQTHDAVAIRKAGGRGFGKGSQAASYKVWKEFVLPLLDDATFEGRDKERFLREVHRGIVTGVHTRSQLSAHAEFAGVGALSKKVSQNRVLHFKGPDEAFAYNKRFGSRNLRDGVIGDLKRAAHSIGLMENYGPNPEMTFDSLVREFTIKARSSQLDAKYIKDLNSGALRASFNEIAGYNDIPENVTLHAITRGLKDLQSLAKLGGVTLSSIPDKAFFHSAGRFQGIRNMDLITKQLGIVVPRTPEEKIALHEMGAALDSFLSSVASRFATNEGTGGAMLRLQQTMFTLNGLAWWTDVHKGAFAKLTAMNLGDNAHLKRQDVSPELRNILDLYSINNNEWHVLRSLVYTVEGRKYITPDRVSQVDDATLDWLASDIGLKPSENNRLRMRDELETKLRALIADQVDDAVPTPGARERRLTSWNSQAGTGKGAFFRLLMMFKSFPITIFERAVKREVYGHGSESVMEFLLHDKKGIFRLSQLIAMTTVGGYLSSAVKDAVRGRTPRRLVEEDGSINYDVILHAMQRGGGLGIYGDLLFSEYDRTYKNALNILAGPVIGQVPEIAATITDLKQGKNIAKPTEKLILGNTPFINLFYIRPVLDYLVLWNIQEMLDPGSLTDMEESVEEKNHQGFWLAPSKGVGVR